jgi:pimeloyl-ACP methyl ester carboxylesterase
VDTYEQVSYYSKGERVSAWYFRPRATPAPAVVMCSGFGGTKDGFSNHMYAPGLAAAGYGVLVIDYRGWGESEGERSVIDPFMQVEDTRAGLSYLETRQDVDPARLGLVGLSYGGAVACYTAAFDERVLAGVSILGVGDTPTWLRAIRREHEWLEWLEAVEQDRRQRAAGGEGRLVDPTEELMVPNTERIRVKGRGSPFRTPLACADALLQFRPVDHVHRIAPRAYQWIAARHDPVVPYEQAQQCYAAAGEPKRLVTLPSREHYGAYEAFKQQIQGETIAWFGQYLR